MATFTVTATQGGTNGPANGMALRVFVLTQAAATQNGATSNNQFTGATSFTQSITTTQTGSRVYGASAVFPNQSATAAAATTVVDNVADATNNARYVTFKATSLTGTPGATTLGFTVGGASAGPFAQAEILTAGTLTEDASGPAAASTTSATTVTTASFTPPAGALLVALVAADGGTGTETMALTDTSGLGLIWVEVSKNNPAAGDYAGVWVAQLPAGVPPLPQPGGQVWRRQFRRTQVLPDQGTAGPPALPVALPLPQPGGRTWQHQFRRTQAVPGPGSPDAAVAGVAAQVTAAGGVGAAEGDAAVTGAAAQVTVAGGIGVFEGDAATTGVAAQVTVAGGAGAVDAQSAGPAPQQPGGQVWRRQFRRTQVLPGVAAAADAAVAGAAAQVTVAGGAGVFEGDAAVAGAAAQVPAAGGVGVSEGDAAVTGTGAQVTAAGGAGTPVSDQNLTGLAAQVTAGGGVGSPSGQVPAPGAQQPGGRTWQRQFRRVQSPQLPILSAAVAGVAAGITAAGGIGAAEGDAAVAGVAAPVTAAAGAGVLKGDAAVTGIPAAVPAAGGAGTAAGTAAVAGTAAPVGAAGGTGVPAGTSGIPAAITGVAARLTAAGGGGTLPALQRGSWWQLLSILREQADWIDYYQAQPPVACPNDGTPLLAGPPQESGILFCPFDGWQYPRDWDPETMSGM